MEILKNPWFVGIATGLISSIIGYFLTKWFVDKKGKKEYYKQVNAANHSVITALKPYIADQGLPSYQVFGSLISSTSRSFCVNEKDMFSISIFCEELIREVISDVYVSNVKKHEYTDKLAQYKQSIQVEELISTTDVLMTQSRLYSDPLKSRFSMYTAILAGFVGIICSILVLITGETATMPELQYPYNENPLLLVPIILILVLTMILAMFTASETLLKIIKKLRKSSQDEE